MKRFLVFSYPTYYPGGGTNDLCGDFETYEEAKAKAESEVAYKKQPGRSDKGTWWSQENQYANILDTETGKTEEVFFDGSIKYGEEQPVIEVAWSGQ